MLTMDSGGGSGGRFAERAASSKSARDASITRLCHPGRKCRRPAASRSTDSIRRRAGAEVANPPSAVMGGSLSHLKCPTKAAKRGEGCAFSRSQKSCLQSQSRRRTRNVSERTKINQLHRLLCSDFGDDTSMFKAVRPTTQTLVELRHEAVVEDPSAKRPKVRAPTTVAWTTTRRKW